MHLALELARKLFETPLILKDSITELCIKHVWVMDLSHNIQIQSTVADILPAWLGHTELMRIFLKIGIKPHNYRYSIYIKSILELSGFWISAMAWALISMQAIGTTHIQSVLHGNGHILSTPKLWIGTPGRWPLLVDFILGEIKH